MEKLTPGEFYPYSGATWLEPYQLEPNELQVLGGLTKKTMQL